MEEGTKMANETQDRIIHRTEVIAFAGMGFDGIEDAIEKVERVLYAAEILRENEIEVTVKMRRARTDGAEWKMLVEWVTFDV